MISDGGKSVVLNAVGEVEAPSSLGEAAGGISKANADFRVDKFLNARSPHPSREHSGSCPATPINTLKEA